MDDRVGQQKADPGQCQEECKVHGEHRQAAREARALEEGDSRVEDQRDESRHDEDHKHFPRRARERPQREQRQRQRHQLHPPGHHHARGRGRRGVRAAAPPSVHQLALLWRGGSAAGAGASEVCSSVLTGVTCLPSWAKYG